MWMMLWTGVGSCPPSSTVAVFLPGCMANGMAVQMWGDTGLQGGATGPLFDFLKELFERIVKKIALGSLSQKCVAAPCCEQ